MYLQNEKEEMSEDSLEAAEFMCFEGLYKKLYLGWWTSIVYRISTSYSFQEYNPEAVDIAFLIQKTRIRILWSYVTAKNKKVSYFPRTKTF